MSLPARPRRIARALLRWVPPLIVATGIASATASGNPPEDVHAPLQMEAGTWDAEVTFFTADTPSGHARGVQTNRLLANGHRIVNEFRIPAGDGRPPYEGIGVWGYDTVAKAYVGTWNDTNDLSVRIDHGYWHAAKRTMVWSSKVNDGAGHFVDYRITEEFRGDERVFTFYQLGIVEPDPHPLVKIVFTRRTAAEAGSS